MDTWDFLQPLWFHCKCHQPKKNPCEQFRYGFSELFRFLSTLLYEVWPNLNFLPKIAPLWCTIFNRMNILSLHTCLLWIFDPKWGIWNSSTSNADANCRFCGPVLFFDIFRNILVISFQIFLNIWCFQSNPHEISWNLICYTWSWTLKLHEWDIMISNIFWRNQSIIETE